MIRRFRPCTLLWALGLGLVGCAGCALERGPGIAAGSHTQEAGQILVPASLVGSWVVASTMQPLVVAGSMVTEVAGETT